MAKITKFQSKSPDRKDLLLGTEYPSGLTTNFPIGSIENLFMSTKADRKIPVELEADFTVNEPSGWQENDRYINTTTGIASSSGTPVVADYIYEIINGEWVEIVPVAGFTLFNKDRLRNLVYTGSAWVSNSVTQAEMEMFLEDGVDDLDNKFDQNFEFDENGNIISFSEAYNTRVRNTLTGDGFALSTQVEEVGSKLTTLEGTVEATSRDVQNTFAGIPGTFKQDEQPPLDSALNSIWYDTNDGNKIYALQESIYVGAPHEWVEITDERLEELRRGVGASRSFLVDANGRVAGMKIGITDTGPSFISFLADTFKIFNNNPADLDGDGVPDGDVAPFEVVDGEVKIKSAHIGQINIGSIPDEAQTTIIYATDAAGSNASTNKYFAGGNPRTHWFLANTKWSDGDGLSIDWTFERITGNDSYSILLSNENHSITALTDGTLDLTGTGTVISVFRGDVELNGKVSGSAGDGEYLVTATPTGISIGSISSNGNRVVVQDMPLNTTMSGNSASIDYAITLEGITTVVKTQTFSKALQGATGGTGAAGIDSKSIKLTPSTHVIAYGKDGSESDTVTFTTEKEGVNGTVGYKFFVDNVAQSVGSVATSTFTLPDSSEPGPGEITEVEVELIIGNTVVARDSVSIYGVQDGKDSITGFLTNASHVVGTPSDGTVPSGEFSDAGGEFKVFRGATDVTSQCTFSLLSSSVPTGVTASINSSSGAYSISQLTPDNAKITFNAFLPASVTRQANSANVEMDYSISKSKAGVDAIDAKTLKLSPSKHVINYAKDGTESDSIVFSTDLQGIVTQHQDSVNGTFVGYRYYIDGVSQNTNPDSSVTGSSFTLPDASEPGPGEVVTVKAEVISNGNVLAMDSVSIYGVQDGKDSLTGFLTNASHVLAASASGSVASSQFANAGGDFKVFRGGEDITSDCSFSLLSYNGASSTGGSINSSGEYSITAVGPDAAKITFRAAIPASVARQTSSVNIDLDYSVSKAKTGVQGASVQGAAGLANSTGVIFYKTASSTSPGLPVSTSSGNSITFNFSTGNFTNLNSTLWSKSSPEIAPGTSSSSFWTSRYYVTESSSGSNSGNVTFAAPVAAYNFNQVVTFSALGVNGSTQIDGSRITTGSLNSSNYIENGENGFAAAGTEIDLSNGSIHSKSFRVDSDGSAYFGGAHSAGSIGNWNITADGILKDDSNKISLDPTSKSITMRDSSGELKTLLSANTSLSDPAASNPLVYGIGSVSTTFALSTDSSLPLTNRSYSDHASQVKYDSSNTFSIPREGAYEVTVQELGIQTYPSWFIDSIIADMPDVGVNVPSSMSQSMFNALTAAGASTYGRTWESGYLPSSALIETILQVGDSSSSTWQVYDEKTLARQEIRSFNGTYSWFYRSSTGPRNAGDTDTGYENSRGVWYKETYTDTNRAYTGDFEQLVSESFILNLPYDTSAKIRIILKVTIIPSVSVTYGTNTTLAPTKTINQWTFSRSNTVFSPLLESYGRIELATPVNFSEVSGGGLQVVTNEDKYVRMRRREANASQYAPDELLEVTGGPTRLYNEDRTALIVSGGGVGFDGYVDTAMEVYGDMSITGKINSVSISNSQSQQEYPLSRLPGAQSTLADTTRFHQQNTNTSHYVQLPGGTIIQWGHVYAGSGSGTKSVAFPVTFPTGVGCVVCSTNRNSPGGSGYNHVYDYGRQGAKILLDDKWGFWVAFGY
jgi:hypothetical protein